VARPGRGRVRADARPGPLRGHASAAGRLARAGPGPSAGDLGRGRVEGDAATRRDFEGRTILRINTYFSDEPKAGEDERGRHAIEGPPEWIAERLDEYVEAGCDGFVVNLDHEAPDLEDRARRFGAEVAPLVT